MNFIFLKDGTVKAAEMRVDSSVLQLSDNLGKLK